MSGVEFAVDEAIAGAPASATVAIGTDAVAVASQPAPAALSEGRSDGANAANAKSTVDGAVAPGVAQVLQKPAAKQHQATVGQPAKPHAFAKPADGPGIGGAVFALILVVSLILGLGWLARRMPGVGRASNTHALRIVGSLSLGPRDRVVVVEVGGTQLLVGVGQNGMTTLHTLAEPLPVAQPSQGTSASPFAQLLAQHFGKKP
jgi:flagellar protein FliO/FliZ